MSSRRCSAKRKSGSWYRRKKRALTRHGRRLVQVRTLHGQFAFALQRFRSTAGQEIRFLEADELTGPGVTALCLYYANRLSFDEVALLAERVAGKRIVSADGVWRLVQREAQRLDQEQHERIRASAGLPCPVFTALPLGDLYQAQSAEVVVLTDGICVKAQKPTREREKEGQTPKPKPDKRHETDVMLLPRRDGSLAFISEGVSGAWSLVEAAHAFLRDQWGAGEGKPLPPLVAITDGAKAIRDDLAALFGWGGVRVVLDWYHLAKRVYQNLSMAAHSMREREAWERQVLGCLWKGRIAEAVAFLSSLAASVRNSKALLDLLGYLDKHAGEIIDYERRQTAGKPIGSGRMEKAVDQVIGLRQKDHGMSWTKAGSRALALLRVAELNACPCRG